MQAGEWHLCVPCACPRLWELPLNRRCAQSWGRDWEQPSVQCSVWGAEETLSSPRGFVCASSFLQESSSLDTVLSCWGIGFFLGINDINNVFYVVKKLTGSYSSKIWGFFITVYSQLWAKLLFIHGLLDHEANFFFSSGIFSSVFYLVVEFFLSLEPFVRILRWNVRHLKDSMLKIVVIAWGT